MKLSERQTKYIIVAIFAILSYALTYFAVIALREWGVKLYDWSFTSKKYNAMYSFAPIAAFVLVFFGLIYWKGQFNEKVPALIFIYIVGIIALLFAFWLNLWFFYSDRASMIIGGAKAEIERINLLRPDLGVTLDASYSVCLVNCNQQSGFGCNQSNEGKEILLRCEVNYLSEFYQSAFFPFWLSSIFSGIFFFAYVLIEGIIWKKSTKHN
ncbi:MAG: hypothetical protein N3F05_00115 [Candidatus Diapherotrites archaeon]|nr:hypothetical protein [Candidatus Diapherotrites archaeon]